MLNGKMTNQHYIYKGIKVNGEAIILKSKMNTKLKLLKSKSYEFNVSKMQNLRKKLRARSHVNLQNQRVECRFYITYMGNFLGSISLFFDTGK